MDYSLSPIPHKSLAFAAAMCYNNINHKSENIIQQSHFKGLLCLASKCGQAKAA